MNRRDARWNLEAIFARRGMRPALVFLNSLTEHRFTAVYRCLRGGVEPICVYDRLRPRANSATAGFMSAVSLTTGVGVVLAPLPLVDPELPRREVQAYCGVTLRDDEGRAFGFICHFDFRPVPIHSANIELLEEAAALLSRVELPAAERK